MSLYDNKNLTFQSPLDGIHKLCWQSPSNIALIKYWGKYGNQLPRNPSLSFTLQNSYTEALITYSFKNEAEGISLEFYFERKENTDFKNRVEKYLISLIPIFPFLKQLNLRIETKNTFPHSSGIASSAASMSAIALCLCSIEQKHFDSLKCEDDFYSKASYVARLGSGSAARSVYGGFVSWGKSEEIENSSNEFALPLKSEIHDNFKDLCDSVLIVSSGKKKVSSSAGHKLMENHPFADSRIKQANQNLKILLKSLKSGDFNMFIEIVENEAMTLHSLMMSSNPSYTLLLPNTLNIINKIREFRSESKLPICFTLDAGPNVHIIFPRSFENQIYEFIEKELLVYCEPKFWIKDFIGKGPKLKKEFGV
ncbi:MAG: diphosphomevalonate decarboxylase [Saprospiraceae bacterium]|nr:diphosphomevalonate decarboxylase [Saprospiraceae bacterium]